MRRFAMGSVVVAVALGAAPACAQQSVADPARNLSNGPGCLGQTAEACVQWLRTTMQLDEGRIASALSRRHMTDVNGRPFGSGLVNLSGRIPGHTQTQVMLLRLAPDDTVASVEASLLGDLIPARAAEAYDQSGVYDIVARILGRRCPGLERLALYRFIENAVKPRLKMERRDLSAGLLGRHRVTARAANVPWCGARFTYTTFVEWTGANNMEAGRNPAGYWSIEVK
jgi:hypothetical protein